MDWFCVGQAFLIGLWKTTFWAGIAALFVASVCGVTFGVEKANEVLKQKTPRVQVVLAWLVTRLVIVVFGAYIVLMMISFGLEALACKVSA